MKAKIDVILEWCDINLMQTGFLVLYCYGIVMGLLLFTYIEKYKKEEFYLDWSLEDPVKLDPISKEIVLKQEKRKHIIIMLVLIPLIVFFMRILMQGNFFLCLFFLLFYWWMVYILHILWNKWYYWKWRRKRKW